MKHLKESISAAEARGDVPDPVARTLLEGIERMQSTPYSEPFSASGLEDLKARLSELAKRMEKESATMNAMPGRSSWFNTLLGDEGIWAGMNRRQRVLVVVLSVILAAAFAWYNLVYYGEDFLRPTRFFYGLVVPVFLVGCAIFVLLAKPTRTAGK